jgi:hypothetical protein
MDHLGGGVHPGVGTAGTGEVYRGPGDASQSGAEGTGHGALTLLGRKSVEGRTVVGHRQAPADGSVDGSVARPPTRGGRAHTNSMRAIGALSPDRLPSLRMRV